MRGFRREEPIVLEGAAEGPESLLDVVRAFDRVVSIFSRTALDNVAQLGGGGGHERNKCRKGKG